MLPPGADPNGVQASYENGGELRCISPVLVTAASTLVGHDVGQTPLSHAAVTTCSADRQDTQDRGVQGAAAEEDRSTVDVVLLRKSLARVLLQVCSQRLLASGLASILLMYPL